jgi:hypothetical protein
MYPRPITLTIFLLLLCKSFYVPCCATGVPSETHSIAYTEYYTLKSPKNQVKNPPGGNSARGILNIYFTLLTMASAAKSALQLLATRFGFGEFT